MIKVSWHLAAIILAWLSVNFLFVEIHVKHGQWHVPNTSGKVCKRCMRWVSFTVLEKFPLFPVFFPESIPLVVFSFWKYKKISLFLNWGWWAVVVVSTMTILINPFPENQIRPNNTKTRVLPLHCPVKLFVTVSSFQSIPPASASVALSIVCITKLNCVKLWKYSASLTSISDWKVTTLPKNWRSMRIRNDVIQ